MERIQLALQEGRSVLYEGACGSGKTVVSLCPALATAKMLDKKVIVATNMRQQLLQFVEESKGINKINHIRVAVLEGKASTCRMKCTAEECDKMSEATNDIIQLIRKDDKVCHDAYHYLQKSRTINMRNFLEWLYDKIDKPEELTSSRICPYLLKARVASLAGQGYCGWLYSDVRSPTEIEAKALEEGVCTHALVTSCMFSADLILCNFYHILSPAIRSILLRWTDADSLDDFIIIFDEAHNVEDVARKLSSSRLSQRTVYKVLFELTGLDPDKPDREKVGPGDAMDVTIYNCIERFEKNAEFAEYKNDVASLLESVYKSMMLIKKAR